MATASTQETPFVSVVIPVLNNAERLREVLEALQRQTHPQDKYEVIVVDNGSTDESPQVAQDFENVTLLFETNHLKSPYSARNRGIKAAQGEIVALLDSTCEPTPEWIAEGVGYLHTEGADIVGGEIEFEFGDKVTVGKIYDAISNVRVRHYIEKRGVAVTGNLFVQRSVFKEYGLFPKGIRSGGDHRWSGGAVEAGYTLVYGPEAKVYYPARPLRPLLKKYLRIAKAHPSNWLKSGEVDSALQACIRIVKRALFPPRPARIRERIEARGQPFMNDYLLRLWLVNYLAKVVMVAGWMTGMIPVLFGSGENTDGVDRGTDSTKEDFCNEDITNS